jgi:hypothetical protein
MNKDLWLAILCGGLVAGTLDIGMAALISSLHPLIILRAVASGLLGKPAMSGGNGIAVLGMVLQWAMSLIIAAIYVLAGLRLPNLIHRWLPASLAYGVVVFVVMSYIVVPLSNAPFKANSTAHSFWMNLLAMLLYGLIIGFFAQRFVKHR